MRSAITLLEQPNMPDSAPATRPRLEAWLRPGRVAAWLTALSVLLSLPSVGAGLRADDHPLVHNARRMPAWAIYGAPHEDFVAGREMGVVAWWTSSALDIRFLRPLSGLIHAFELRHWPKQLWLMHFCNVLLYAALVWVALRLYQRLLPDRRSWILAALMFAVDDAHAQSVGWIAARNTLLGALFSLATLLLHVNARETRSRTAVAASVGCLGAALLAAESGLSGFMLLVAYALVLDTGSLRARLTTLTPYLWVLLPWAAFYAAFGFGAHGTSWLRSFHAPLSLLGQGMLDVPAWFVSLFGASAVSALLMWPLPVLRIVTLVLAAPLLWALWPVLKPAPVGREPARTRLFFLLATVLCILPLFTTLPQDRLTVPASFGAFGVIGCLFEALLTQTGAAARWRRGSMVGLHLVLSPLLFIPGLHAIQPLENGIRATLAQLPPTPGQEIVLVNSPAELLSVYVYSAAWNTGTAVPGAFHQLFTGRGSVTASRVDARTLELYAPRGWGGIPIQGSIFDRQPGTPRAGDEVRVRHMRAKVEATGTSGMPERVRFEFPDALDAPGRVWLVWRGTRPERWLPPAIGMSETFAPLDPLSAFER